MMLRDKHRKPGTDFVDYSSKREEKELHNDQVSDIDYDIIDTRNETFSARQHRRLIDVIMKKVESNEMCNNSLYSEYIKTCLFTDRYILAVRKDNEYIGFATLNDIIHNNIKGMHLEIACSQPGKGVRIIDRAVQFARRDENVKFLSLESTLTAMATYIKMRFPPNSTTQFVIGKGCDESTKQLKQLHEDVVKQKEIWEKLNSSGVDFNHSLNRSEKNTMDKLLKKIQSLGMRSKPSGYNNTYNENDAIHMTMCFMKEPAQINRRQSRRLNPNRRSG